MIDFTKVTIMSRDMTFDKKMLDSFRILNVFNKIENIDFAFSYNEEEARRIVNDRLDVASAEVKHRVVSVRGSVMLMESGIRNAGSGQVLVTTMIHFADTYSMQMFVMKYPHKAWDHDEAMSSMSN